MSQDYPLNSESFYETYFKDDPTDWESLGVTHAELILASTRHINITGHCYPERQTLTDEELGKLIRKGREKHFYKQEWHRYKDKDYMSDFTTKEIGSIWRMQYTDCFDSQ